ncbi:site-specific DNA-methyltransferase [Methanobacterium sp.]|uniref:site-specific DNA-methyltransferase n=1 Tax=Methanobacterium sp. TaxID=2164 RepID=UPI0031586F61
MQENNSNGETMDLTREKMQETKLNGESLDIVAENVSKLKELFPEIITEDKIDFDKLKEVLGEYAEEDRERYNFTWKGKLAALRIAQTPSTGTLRPCKEESKNWGTTQNLYLEGDNLEVLKLLQKSYYGKIKMIYIDPPYNTGKDFVYRDNYKDNLQNYLEMTEQIDKEGMKLSTNTDIGGRYHTNWLNMIYPRLRLARNLLTEDGVIFISIDDNELENLKKICDEIFGEENFVSTICVNRTSEIASNYTVSKHEYIIVYSKSINHLDIFNKTKITISRGTVGNKNQTMPEITFPAGLKCYGMDDGVYEATRKIDGSLENIENLDPIIIENGALKEDVRLIARWRSSNDMRNFFANDCKPTKAKITGEIVEIYFENDRFNPQIKKRTYEKIPSIFFENTRGSKDLDELNINFFDFPKSTKLLNYIVNFSKKNDIILDFFCGSATTAHSVIQVNAEDKGARKFIMVQLPESIPKESEAYNIGYKNICEMSKERIRRAGDKILNKSKEEQKTFDNDSTSNLDIGFKVFKLDSSNLAKWNPDYDNLEQKLLDSVENIIPGRCEFDLIYEIMLKYGVDLTLPIIEYNLQNNIIYSIGLGALVICLENDIKANIATEIIKLKNELSPEIMRVVFKDNGFANDSDKTNIKETLMVHGIEEFVTI